MTKTRVKPPSFYTQQTQARSPEREILRLLVRLGEQWTPLTVETHAEGVALRTLIRAGAIQVDAPGGVARLTLTGLRWKGYLSNPNDITKERGFVLECVWKAHVARNRTTAPSAEQEAETKSESVPVVVDADTVTARLAAIVGDSDAARKLAVARDKSKTAEQRIRLIVEMDRRSAALNSRQWAELLGVKPAAITKTSWWKNERDDLLRRC